MDTRSKPADPPAARRCVVLVASGSPMPGNLLDGLRRRSVEVILLSHPSEVMVELACRGATMLVVDDPAKVPLVNELVGAVRRYYPMTALWRYDSQQSGSPSLYRFATPMPASRVEVSQAGRVQPVAPQRAEGPVRTKTEEGPLMGRLLSTEELDMLLGRPFDEPTPGRRPVDDEEGL